MEYGEERGLFTGLRDEQKGGSILVENLSSSSDQMFFKKGKGASAVFKNIKPDFTQSDRVTPVGEITLTPAMVHVRGA